MGSEGVRAKAFEDYQKGMKYKDIAEKYGVSLSAVKSWASRYWKKEGCGQTRQKPQPKKEKVATKGAPKGNQNAVGNKGGAAPKENKNAIKTGEFESLFFDTLEPEEGQMIAVMPTDKESLLLQEIQLLTIRERRMLRRIEGIRTSPEDIVGGEEAGMTLVKRQAGIEKEKETDLKEYQGKLGQIQAIEDALTRVQARKQKAIDSLHRFGFDDARLEIEIERLRVEKKKTEEDLSGSGLVDDWIAGITGTEPEGG